MAGARTAACFFVLLASLTLRAPAHAETLLEAFALAKQNDPRFKAAQFDSQASGMAIDQARAGFLPTLKFDAEQLETRQKILRSNNPIFGAGVSSFPTETLTLTLTQPLFRKDAIERYAQAKAVVRQAQYTLLAMEQELMLRTTAAYLAVLAASDGVELARAEREAIARHLELAREKLRMGLGTITNVLDAQARHAVNQAREIEAENKLRDARQALAEITGAPIARFQSLRPEFTPIRPDPAVLERWIETAFEQNLGYRARREAVEVAFQEKERQRAGHFPSLNLVATHTRRDAGSTLFGGGSLVETSDLMLRLSVPIYEGGLTSAVTQEASFRHQKALEEQEQERRSVERQTRAAFQGAISGLSLVQALEQSVVSQQKAVEVKEEGLRAGLFTLLPVLDAQRDLYMARRDHAQARYDYLLNSLKLKHAAGTLSDGDLSAVGAALK